uniref:Uncharacterized protein n=1 Tax=Cyprinus carpio TaxID=7962 RepID=A0A8C2E5H1_CYPCA
MTMSCAKLTQNLSKNRYRDISPYDATRVILKGTDDYINANYINMEIPASSLINRYIACQGPLPNTCPDFWQMTWEQGSSLVVMLTTQVERGRVKCHQYWPNPSGSATYAGFQVSCQTEEGNSAFLVRDMTLTQIEVSRITDLHYLAWPDHGVPDDSTDFLDFVTLVRSKRAGKDEPVVVHCSAGIGRTGVLITMETAMCLMECGQPVYPLEIVRTMRDQRAMMIQTPVSPAHLPVFLPVITAALMCKKHLYIIFLFMRRDLLHMMTSQLHVRVMEKYLEPGTQDINQALLHFTMAKRLYARLQRGEKQQQKI